jgi:hypothetical protein
MRERRMMCRLQMLLVHDLRRRDAKVLYTHTFSKKKAFLIRQIFPVSTRKVFSLLKAALASAVQLEKLQDLKLGFPISRNETRWEIRWILERLK